jgi:hypothetical protein
VNPANEQTEGGQADAGPADTGQADTGQADAGQADTGQASGRRATLVAAAQEQWASAPTDLGGRNTLLYYKDRRAGTLDLTAAAPEALDRLLRTGTIRLTRLFHDVDIRADAIRRVQAIYRKAHKLTEERAWPRPTSPPAWRAGTSCSWSPRRRCCCTG